jgi:hypothetical protein
VLTYGIGVVFGSLVTALVIALAVFVGVVAILGVASVCKALSSEIALTVIVGVSVSAVASVVECGSADVARTVIVSIDVRGADLGRLILGRLVASLVIALAVLIGVKASLSMASVGKRRLTNVALTVVVFVIVNFALGLSASNKRERKSKYHKTNK